MENPKPDAKISEAVQSNLHSRILLKFQFRDKAIEEIWNIVSDLNDWGHGMHLFVPGNMENPSGTLRIRIGVFSPFTLESPRIEWIAPTRISLFALTSHKRLHSIYWKLELESVSEGVLVKCLCELAFRENQKSRWLETIILRVLQSHIREYMLEIHKDLASNSRGKYRLKHFGKFAKIQRTERQIYRILSNASDLDSIWLERFSHFLFSQAHRNQSIWNPAKFSLGSGKATSLSPFFALQKSNMLSVVWEIVCPACQVSHYSVGSLNELKDRYRCSHYGREFFVSLDENVFLAFQAKGGLVPYFERKCDWDNPARLPGRKMQMYLEPGEESTIQLDLGKGKFNLWRSNSPRQRRFQSEGDTLRLKFSNRTKTAVWYRIEKKSERAKSISALRFLLNPKMPQSLKSLSAGIQYGIHKGAFLWLECSTGNLEKSLIFQRLLESGCKWFPEKQNSGYFFQNNPLPLLHSVISEMFLEPGDEIPCKCAMYWGKGRIEKDAKGGYHLSGFAPEVALSLSKFAREGEFWIPKSFYGIPFAEVEGKKLSLAQYLGRNRLSVHVLPEQEGGPSKPVCKIFRKGLS